MSQTAYQGRPEPALLFGCGGPLKNPTPATMDYWKRLEFKRLEFKSKTRSAIARYDRYSAGHSTAKGNQHEHREPYQPCSDNTERLALGRRRRPRRFL